MNKSLHSVEAMRLRRQVKRGNEEMSGGPVSKILVVGHAGCVGTAAMVCLGHGVCTAAAKPPWLVLNF